MVKIRRFETRPTRVHRHEPFQQPAVDHTQLRDERAPAKFGVVQHSLHGDEIIPGYDPFMVIPVQALRPVAPVLAGFVRQVTGRPGFPRQHIAAVPFVAQNLDDGIGRPLHVSQVSPLSQFGHCVCNLLRGVAVQIHIKDQFHGRGFLGVDHQVAVRIVGIAEQFRGERKPAVQAHPQRGLHAPAADV